MKEGEKKRSYRLGQMQMQMQLQMMMGWMRSCHVFKSRQLLCLVCAARACVPVPVPVSVLLRVESSRVAFISFHCPILSLLFLSFFFLSSFLLFFFFFSLSLSLLPALIKRGEKGVLFSGSLGQRRRGGGKRELELDGESMSGVARSFRSRNESMQVMQCNARGPIEKGGEEGGCCRRQSTRLLSGCLLLACFCPRHNTVNAVTIKRVRNSLWLF